MARLPPPNRIKTHRIYTVWEAVDVADARGRPYIADVKITPDHAEFATQFCASEPEAVPS